MQATVCSLVIQLSDVPEWPPSSQMRCLIRAENARRSPMATGPPIAASVLVSSALDRLTRSVSSLHSWLRTTQPLLNEHTIMGRVSSMGVWAVSSSSLYFRTVLLNRRCVCDQHLSLSASLSDEDEDESLLLDDSFVKPSIDAGWDTIGTPKSVEATKFE